MASVAKRKWTYKGADREAWVVRYKDRGGAHRSRQFDLKKEADAYKRKVENEMEAGTHIAIAQTITVASLAEKYLAHMDHKLQADIIRRGARENVSARVRPVIEALGSVKLTELKWQQVVELAETLQRTPSAKTKRPLARNTILDIFGQFKRMVDFGVRSEFVGRNVVSTALQVIELSPAQAIVTFSRDEIRSLVEAIEAWEPSDQSARMTRTRPLMRALVYCAAFCGLRLGEILALRWSDIDFDRGSIRVSHSLDLWDTLKGPKTVAGLRTVPMPSFVAAALEAFRAHAVVDNRGLIFRTRTGAAFGRSGVSPKWRILLNRAGISKTAHGYRHFHALRHFAGSAWLDAGMPLADVSKLLGHANPQITARVYMHSIAPTETRAPLLEKCAAFVVAPKALITQELLNAA